MKRLFLASTVLAVLSASPVLAQSFDPEYGTGNTVAFSGDNAGLAYAQARTTRLHGVRAQAEPQPGIRTFGYAPGYGVTADNPQATGGGSIGYNEKLLHD